MDRARVFQEVRIMRFESLLDRHERGDLSQIEAAAILGVSERTFRRWCGRYREEGAVGLLDGRLDRPSPRRAPESELARARALYAEMYGGFTVKYFHEKLVARHGYKLGYTVTRLALQRAGLVRRAPRRGAHRRKRPRRPMAGMLMHQDGSTHAWLAGRPPLDLIVTLDDATSVISSASWSRRKAPPRASGAWPRRSPPRGSSARFTPTGRRITSTRPRPGARSRKTSRPRSAGPWRHSASST